MSDQKDGSKSHGDTSDGIKVDRQGVAQPSERETEQSRELKQEVERDIERPKKGSA